MADLRVNPRPPSISASEELMAACGKMREALERDQSANPVLWASQLVEAARAMEAAFTLHCNLAEAVGGTLEEIIEFKPELAPRVAAQRDEHQELRHKPTALIARLKEQMASERLAVEELELEARILVDSVRLHMMRGSDLLYNTYFQEDGGES